MKYTVISNNTGRRGESGTTTGNKKLTVYGMLIELRFEDGDTAFYLDSDLRKVED